VALTLPSVTRGPFGGFPFVEVERLHVRSRDPRSFFSPRQFYGSTAPWMATAGIRLRYGPLHARMGRYGVARVAGPAIATLGTNDGHSH
jgi:hypothetical protein